MNIFVFGDSIAFGFNDENGVGWVDRLKADYIQRSLQTEEFMKVYNLAVSGHDAEQVSTMIQSEVDHRGDDEGILILALGVNEARATSEQLVHSWDQQKSFLNQAVIAAKQACPAVIVVGCTPSLDRKTTPVSWDDNHYRCDDIKKVNDYLEETASKHGLDFVSVWDEFIMSGIEELLPDGLHPNAKGHEIIYNRVKEQLDTIL